MLQRAVALEAGNPEVVRAAAASAAYLGRFGKALPLARRAVDLDPLNAHSGEGLGEIEFLDEQSDEAVTHLKKAAELSPDRFQREFVYRQIKGLIEWLPDPAKAIVTLIVFASMRVERLWLFAGTIA